jgi:hypothetical protein
LERQMLHVFSHMRNLDLKSKRHERRKGTSRRRRETREAHWSIYDQSMLYTCMKMS